MYVWCYFNNKNIYNYKLYIKRLFKDCKNL